MEATAAAREPRGLCRLPRELLTQIALLLSVPERRGLAQVCPTLRTASHAGWFSTITLRTAPYYLDIPSLIKWLKERDCGLVLLSCPHDDTVRELGPHLVGLRTERGLPGGLEVAEAPRMLQSLAVLPRQVSAGDADAIFSARQCALLAAATSLTQLNISGVPLHAAAGKRLAKALPALPLLADLRLAFCALTALPAGLPRGLTALDLSSNGFGGHGGGALSQLAGLGSLRRLSLATSGITVAMLQPNTLPTGLTMLALARNALGGLTEHSLSNLRRLQELDLSHSHASAAAAARLPALTALNLTANDLSSSGLAPLGACEQLRSLGLSDCRLEPAALGPLSRVSGLSHLALTHNFGLGQHADRASVGSGVFARLSGLRSLDMRFCGLRELPAAIAELGGSLTRLGLHNNPDLGGDGAAALEPLAALSQLQCLVLEACDVHALPAACSALTALTEVALSENPRLAADSIARLLPHWSQLRGLWLNHCRLQQVPAAVSCLSALVQLDLSGNDLAADNLAALAALTSLRDLGLAGCRLTAVPASVSCLRGLQRLYLRNNNRMDYGWEHLHELQRLQVISVPAMMPATVRQQVQERGVALSWI